MTAGPTDAGGRFETVLGATGAPSTDGGSGSSPRMGGAAVVFEHATVSVDPARAREFESVLVEATGVLARAEGFLGVDVLRCLEQGGRYVLVVRWRALEDHTVTYRNSELASEFRSFIGPYLVTAPEVLHHVPVALES